MLDLLGEQQPETLKLPSLVLLALHPATVYLDSLGSDRSKATMMAELDIMAKLLTGGECGAMTLNWAALRYRHRATLRSALGERKILGEIGVANCFLVSLILCLTAIVFQLSPNELLLLDYVPIL